jgi:RNA polymerase sigma-70 factor (ECF subfamily)
VGGDVELAEEAAQDALVRLYTSLPRFRGEAAFGTFLYRICRNAAIDALRRRVRERKRFVSLPDPEEGGPEIESHHRGPEEIALREGAKTALRAALAGLAEEERSLVYLKEAEALGLAEIGRILGLPEGTVKSRLFRARAKMRTIIEEAGYELD